MGAMSWMVQDADVQVLVWLGLSGLEAKVYLSLLEIGRANIEDISMKTKIREPDVRCALRELEKRGLVKEVAADPPFGVAVGG